jgi:hypothetical protein
MRSSCVAGTVLFLVATLLSTGCGHSPEGSGPSDAMAHDATGKPDASLVDSSTASDSAKGEDAPAWT